MLRWVSALWVTGAVFVGCSLSSLDDLKSSGGRDAGSCQAKVDCSRCGNCQDECVCVGAPDLVSCITSCQADGGPGHGGTGGSGGADASAGKGGTAASAGTGATGGTLPTGGGGTPSGGGSGGVATGGGGAPTGGGGTPSGGSGGVANCNLGAESDAVSCSDGCDNDNNGATDCADTECANLSVCNFTVACGAANCDLNSYTCCIDAAGDECLLAGHTCNGFQIYCDGPSDCPGQSEVCCAVGGGGVSVQAISCAVKDMCAGQNAFIVCGGDPSGCPANTQCKLSQQFANYMVCLP